MKAPRVFVSYASEDRNTALSICRYLRSCGLSVWIDCECLLPGQIWKDEIAREISESDFIVALLSANSVSKRGFVQKELKIALDVLDTLPHGKIFLIPVRIDDCRVSHPMLSSLHYIDAFGHNWHRGVRYILRSINHTMGVHTKPQETFYALVPVDPEQFGVMMEGAIIDRDIPALSHLLEQGANPSDPSVEYGSPLEFLLCEHEDDEAETVLAIMELFVRHGADVNQKCMHNSSLLMQVDYLEKLPIVRYLVEHGADLEHRNDDGITSLLQSASFGATSSVRLLLQYGANLRATDHKGWTALMHSSSLQASGDPSMESRLLDTARLLLDQGADIDARNHIGQTAADIAAESNLSRIEILFRTWPRAS